MTTDPAPPWRVVWITGASTGIGREVAIKLATRGVKVAASARRADKLETLASDHPNIVPFTLDVTNAERMAQTVDRIEQTLGPIDLAIFSAGLWQQMSAKQFDLDTFNHIIDVNLKGVTNGLAAVMPKMIERGSGHIAPIASIAGYRGLPRSTAYGASKAALINLAESLQPDLKRYGVTVSIINPGFVDTPMTEVNDFPMPFMIPVETAADKIINGLERKKFDIAFAWPLVATLKFARALPYPLSFWFVRTFIAR